MKTNCRMSVPFTMLILLAGLDLVWLRAGYGKAYQPGILGEQANRPPSPLNNTEEPAILHIQVTDSDSQDGIPCRITIADKQNRLAPVSVLPDQQLAARAGVIYTPNGQARIKLPPGKYTLYATRGFEYSLAKKELDLTNGSLCQVQLQIRREVPTPHLISCDTHVHTLTHSGHGDATIDERMLTIAGEGVELPIATDHNFLADYSEAARRMGVEDRFTPVIGAEVTTKKGHFNAFPFKIGSPVPNFRIEEWPQLMAAILIPFFIIL